MNKVQRKKNARAQWAKLTEEQRKEIGRKSAATRKARQMNQTTLDSLIVTEQQAQGLKAFREQQDIGFEHDSDFLQFYILWQYERGYFDDSNDLLKI